MTSAHTEVLKDADRNLKRARGDLALGITSLTAGTAMAATGLTTLLLAGEYGLAAGGGAIVAPMSAIAFHQTVKAINAYKRAKGAVSQARGTLTDLNSQM